VFRVFGKLITIYFVDRGIYSILGAAAYCGSVTRTVSVAMITLEINGHLSHSQPLLVCVLSAYAMSNWISKESFFEMLSRQAGLEEYK
jgi:H+/Cl- antiporter ClcA